MADKTISALPAAATLAGSELVECVQAGNNVKTTAAAIAALASSSADSIYDGIVLAETGLTNYWPLNETSGTTMVDQVGGANGTYVGGVSFGAPLRKLTGVAFDGSSGYAEVASGIAAVSASQTLEFIVDVVQMGSSPNYPTVGATTNYSDPSAGAANKGLRLNLGNGTLAEPVLGYGDGTTTHPTQVASTFPPNAPVHVAIVRDSAANQLRLYINGVLVTTTSAASYSGATSLAVAAVYASGWTSFLGGVVGKVALYNVALTAARIVAHYRATL